MFHSKNYRNKKQKQSRKVLNKLRNSFDLSEQTIYCMLHIVLVRPEGPMPV